MEYLFAGISVLLFLFGFRMGWKYHSIMSKGAEPPKIKNPVQIIKNVSEKKEIEKAAKKESDIWDALDEVDGYSDEERILVYGRNDK